MFFDRHLAPELAKPFEHRFASVVGLHFLQLEASFDLKVTRSGIWNLESAGLGQDYLLQQLVVDVGLLAVVQKVLLGFALGQNGLGSVIAFDVLQLFAALDFFERC